LLFISQSKKYAAKAGNSEKGLAIREKQTAMGGWIRGRPQLRMKIPGSRAASRLFSG